MTGQSPSARGPLPESPAQPRPTPGPHRTVRPVCRADRRASFPGRGHGQPSADSSGAAVATADEYRAAAEHRLSHRLADRSATRFPGKPPPDPRIGRKRRNRPCGPRPHAFRTSRSIRRRSAAQPDTLCGTGLRKRFSPYLRIVQNERIGAIRCRKTRCRRRKIRPKKTKSEKITATIKPRGAFRTTPRHAARPLPASVATPTRHGLYATRRYFQGGTPSPSPAATGGVTKSRRWVPPARTRASANPSPGDGTPRFAPRCNRADPRRYGSRRRASS